MESILIVDDSKSIVDVLKAYMQKEGFNPISASDGEDALSKFRQYNPSLILLDLMLPKINGIEVCKAIRNESNIPIIIISSVSDEKYIFDGFSAGADDYVTKPCSPKLLMAKVKAVLRRTTNGNIVYIR